MVGIVLGAAVGLFANREYFFSLDALLLDAPWALWKLFQFVLAGWAIGWISGRVATSSSKDAGDSTSPGQVAWSVGVFLAMIIGFGRTLNWLPELPIGRTVSLGEHSLKLRGCKWGGFTSCRVKNVGVDVDREQFIVRAYSADGTLLESRLWPDNYIPTGAARAQTMATTGLDEAVRLEFEDYLGRKAVIRK